MAKLPSHLQDIDLTQLPELTEKQEKFARLILDGMTAAEAYRKVYSVEKMCDNSIWCEASKLKTHPKVSQWLQAARIAGLEQGAITHAQFVNRLLELSAKAETAGNWPAAVNALVNAGKAAGHLIERVEDMTPIETIKAREKLAAMAAKADITPIIEHDDEQPHVTH